LPSSFARRFTDSRAATVLWGAAFLLLLIALQVLVMTLWVGGLPNRVVSPPLQHADLYWSLLHSNPAEVVRLIVIDKPLLEIERRMVTGGVSVQVWSAAVFVPGLLIQVFLAGYVALIVVAKESWSRTQWSWRLLGVGVVMLAVMYCRRADCCVGGPGWLLDVALLSYLTGLPDIADGQQLYVELRRWFVLAQLLLGLTGFMLIIHSHKKQEKGDMKKGTDLF
jgi:hypothetical protein